MGNRQSSYKAVEMEPPAVSPFRNGVPCDCCHGWNSANGLTHFGDKECAKAQLISQRNKFKLERAAELKSMIKMLRAYTFDDEVKVMLKEWNKLVLEQ